MKFLLLKEGFWFLDHSIRQYKPSRWWKRTRVWMQNWLCFWRTYLGYVALLSPDRVNRATTRKLLLRHLYPCVQDATANHEIEPIYFYQDAWAFELIVRAQPAQHIDVGSHHKFVALLSKVVPVTMVDIRPLSLELPSLQFRAGSICNLPYATNSIISVSSLCVIEHIGLGRYGDLLDPQGTVKVLRELQRVVRPNGDLYLSVPLDDENLTYFNAHRAFTEQTLLDLFEPFTVVEKRYIFGTRFSEVRGQGFGTGCYHLRKPPQPGGLPLRG